MLLPFVTTNIGAFGPLGDLSLNPIGTTKVVPFRNISLAAVDLDSSASPVSSVAKVFRAPCPAPLVPVYQRATKNVEPSTFSPRVTQALPNNPFLPIKPTLLPKNPHALVLNNR